MCKQYTIRLFFPKCSMNILFPIIMHSFKQKQIPVIVVTRKKGMFVIDTFILASCIGMYVKQRRKYCRIDIAP